MNDSSKTYIHVDTDIYDKKEGSIVKFSQF